MKSSTIRLFALLLCAGSLLASTLGCAVPQISVTPRYGLKSLKGDFRASDSNMVSSSSDLESMGLDDSEGSAGLRADLKMGTPHVVVYGSQFSFSGSGTVDGNFELNNIQFAANEPVDTDFDLGHYTGLLLFDVLPTKSLDLGIGFGLTLLDFDLEITEAPGGLLVAGESASTDEIIPIPILAANGAINVGPVDVSLLVSGMSISVSDAEGTLLDADAAVRWKFIGGKNHLRGAVLLGWRQTDLDFEYDDGDENVEADIGLSGPYLALQLTL